MYRFYGKLAYYVSRDLCNLRLIFSYKLNGSNVPVVSIFFHCIHIGLKCLLKLLFSIKDKSLSSPITIFSFFTFVNTAQTTGRPKKIISALSLYLQPDIVSKWHCVQVPRL